MKRSILLAILFISVFPVFCQDYHYWSEQFGAESHLMGGAVVAGVRDNSAIFYNPGAVGFIEGNSVSVNANIYKVFEITIGLDDLVVQFDGRSIVTTVACQLGEFVACLVCHLG